MKMNGNIISKSEPNALDTFHNAIRLICCRKTARFFSANGWTTQLSDAQRFANEVDAARACVTHGLHDVDLVLLSPLTWVEIFRTQVR